jgi:hypothetical protein
LFKELSHLDRPSQGLTRTGKGWSDSALIDFSLEFEQFEEKAKAVFVTK